MELNKYASLWEPKVTFGRYKIQLFSFLMRYSTTTTKALGSRGLSKLLLSFPVFTLITATAVSHNFAPKL